MLHTPPPHHQHAFEEGDSGSPGAGLHQHLPADNLLHPASAAAPPGAAATTALVPAADAQQAASRPLSFNSRLSDLEQIHDRIRQRLAVKKGLPTSNHTPHSPPAPTRAALNKSLNTAESNYSAVVNAYTLGNVRSALAPTVFAGEYPDDSSDAGSDTTLSPGFLTDVASSAFTDTPLTDLGSFDLGPGDEDMAKKGKGKKAQQKKDDEDSTTRVDDQATGGGDAAHNAESDDDNDSFTSADEQDNSQTTQDDDTLTVEQPPAFAQTRSMVDVTAADDDTTTPVSASLEDKQEDPSTPKQLDATSAKDVSLEPSEHLSPLEIPGKVLPPRPEETESGPHDLQSPPSPPKRKFTSPFSFFSRGNSKPNGLARRDTVTSTASMSTTTNDDVDSDNEATPKRPNRQSLRDRFKLLRMQEETGLVLDDSESSRPGSQGGDKSDAEVVFSPKEEVDKELARRRNSSGTSTMPPGGPILNEGLPAGTAVGTATGPSGDQEPVDWDLWQAVVYEGPAAVARSSTDELNRAITRGIPSAIRGVVWQVLADSKNEDLEAMYRELVARGEKEINARRGSELKTPRPALSRPQSVAESLRDGASSRASVHSGTSPTSAENESAILSPTSQTSSSAQAVARAQLQLAAEQRQKQKDETAALQKLERAIKRDMGARTSYSKFLMSQGLQDGLFGICKAYALFDEEVGYAQGMNFIAMPLLFNMPEEEAFTLFVRLMNHYHLRDLFVAEMPGLHLHLYQFSRLLEDFEPAVYCHLNRRGVQPQLYATQWFLTLFAYRFPLQLVLRIYDLIIAEGLEGAILKFGIVLMQKNAKQLLEMKDMAVLTTFLKERLFDVYIDKTPSANSVLESGFFGSAGGIDKEVYMADQLVQDACAVEITKEMLGLYTREWEEKVREDKAAQLERDSLKSQNASLNLQIRTLRERTEQLDNEHVQIASDLVRTKVQNQQLIDDNESLKTNVKELQNIISAQPGEVEDKLRQEMDRIIARNGEVQNQNRALEEEREQIEGELVRAKLEKAEMSEELDALRQKWSHVSGVMNAATGPRSPL